MAQVGSTLNIKLLFFSHNFQKMVHKFCVKWPKNGPKLAQEMVQKFHQKWPKNGPKLAQEMVQDMVQKIQKNVPKMVQPMVQKMFQKFLNKFSKMVKKCSKNFLKMSQDGQFFKTLKISFSNPRPEDCLLLPTTLKTASMSSL